MRKTKADLQEELDSAHKCIASLRKENCTLNREIDRLREHEEALGYLKQRIIRAMNELEIDLDVINSIRHS